MYILNAQQSCGSAIVLFLPGCLGDAGSFSEYHYDFEHGFENVSRRNVFSGKKRLQ